MCNLRVGPRLAQAGVKGVGAARDEALFQATARIMQERAKYTLRPGIKAQPVQQILESWESVETSGREPTGVAAANISARCVVRGRTRKESTSQLAQRSRASLPSSLPAPYMEGLAKSCDVAGNVKSMPLNVVLPGRLCISASCIRSLIYNHTYYQGEVFPTI